MMFDDLKLVMFCGDHKQALKQHDFGFINAEVVGQTTETGNEMLKLGREYYKELSASGCSSVFSNNDHFLNGLRLTVRDGNLQPNDIKIVYFRGDGFDYEEIYINKDGRLNHWPAGFFDAIENALIEIL